MLIAAVAIFVLVMVLLAAGWRAAAGSTAPTAMAAKGSERIWILGLGLAFPSTVLLALLSYGLWIGERLLPREGADVTRVEARASQLSWTFSYRDAPGRATENVLHIPAGRPVDVAITSADVIHSFWVPRLAGKLDAIPGHVNVLRLEADRPGTYAGLSAEFSGPGYDNLTFTVVAHPPEAWQGFLEDSR
ncbi:cytochrome C oxidase subunit II [Microbaculum marinum]|uniref:Cytochrome C oxidase subunit II n=1 Tax=Microbaculum marinum TaxID=1764581 RepID=A0AAW9RP09_9HYPH